MNANLSTYTATEQRLEAYQSLGWQKGERISVSLNLRQLAYPKDLVPFLPGLGMDWRLFESDRTSLHLKTAFGLGLKLPTLNDRYWEPGGNPNLRPEKSQNGEMGLQLKQTGTFSWSQRLTYYRMQVDDWIIWLPKGSYLEPRKYPRGAQSRLGIPRREFLDYGPLDLASQSLPTPIPVPVTSPKKDPSNCPTAPSTKAMRDCR